MKKTRKMKLIDEIVEILKSQGKEVSHSSVSSWTMSQMRTDAYNEARYGGLKQGDFGLYFREFYDKKPQ